MVPFWGEPAWRGCRGKQVHHFLRNCIKLFQFKELQKSTTILIVCPKSLSGYLKKEVEFHGFTPTAHFPTGVSLRGSLADCMKLNLVLAVAHHVLLFVKEFNCDNPDTLYREIKAVDWENIIAPDGYVCVTSVVHTASITDTRFANLKCKDAIVDRMAEKRGKRCDSGSSRESAVVHIFWQDSRCILYIDTSGEPLTKRGYRKIPGSAPMQETLAAGVVCATGWIGMGNFINPMCGSGTLAIEAALIAHNRAPGIMRQNFGFMHLLPFDKTAYSQLREEVVSREKSSIPCKIIASDHDPNALFAAKTNAQNAGMEKSIQFELSEFDATPVPASQDPGIVLLNPEYGFRMGEAENLKNVYKRIGDFFKHRCSGYHGFVFTGNIQLAKHIGLKSKRKIPFLSGKIECRLYEYELYAGRRDSNEDLLNSSQSEKRQTSSPSGENG
jgi:23S rRNA G2445 N2-methylase RlmL